MAGEHRSSNPFFSQELSCLIGSAALHARLLHFQSDIEDTVDAKVVTDFPSMCHGDYAENHRRRWGAEILAGSSK